MRILTLIILFSAMVAWADDGDRFVKAYRVSSDECVVISEGEMEWESIGSYTIRLHEWVNNRTEPAGEFYSGLVRERNGTIENVFLIDLTGEKKKDVIVTIRCVGTGANLSADAFAVKDKELVLLAHLDSVGPTANLITALKKQIHNQKR